jgi:hypothetical protein
VTANSFDLIALAFSVFNLLRLASYLPQIVAVARDANGATAISFSCWSVWIGANVTTALHGWVNLGDIGFTLMGIFNAVGCAAVMAIAFAKRSGVLSR